MSKQIISRAGSKGIILAGGHGSRLTPISLAISKQLVPVFDKPMIYYPLTSLILAGIQEVAIVSQEENLPLFKRLLGNGSKWGIGIEYFVQNEPKGIADGLIVTKDFINQSSTMLILGDNLFHGMGLGASLGESGNKGAQIYAKEVADPSRYGVVELAPSGEPLALVEKPHSPNSRLAVTGIYHLDESAPDRASSLVPSSRGELEIVDLLKSYLNEGMLSVKTLGRGEVWLDTGTFESLNQAAEYVRIVQERSGLLVGSPDEAAWRRHLIDTQQLSDLVAALGDTSYSRLLRRLVHRG